MIINKVLTREEIEREYGNFFQKNHKVYIDTADVPDNLFPIIPYAEFWGVADDWSREELVQDAPDDIKSNLKWVISQFEDELDAWLAGPEASKSDPSDAYIAFSAMRMGSDYI